MQVLFGQILYDKYDVEIPKSEKDKQPFTLKFACYEALGAFFQDEQNLSGEEKFKRGDLYLKIKSSPDPVDLTAEEVALLKKLIAKLYDPILVSQIWRRLEGKEWFVEKKPPEKTDGKEGA